MRSRGACLPLLLTLLLLGLGADAGRGSERDEKDNPHQKMTRGKSVCIDCHTELPKEGEHAADYFLVDLPSENCLGCHFEYEHPGVQEHAGKEAKPLLGDEKGQIACFTCHDPHPEGVLPGRTVYKTAVNERTRAMIAARELPPGVKRREQKLLFGALLRSSNADGEGGCPECHASRKEPPPWRERLIWTDAIRVLPRY